MNGYIGTDTMVDPALERGAGQIQLPSGQVEHFQFEPPSPEDAGSAMRAAAVRAQQFDLARSRAESQAEYEELYRNQQLKANAQKAMEAMERTIAAGMFQKDVQSGMDQGLTQQEAVVRALPAHATHLFAGNPQAAERAIMLSTGPRFGQTPGGQRYAVAPTGNLSMLPDTGIEEKTLPSGERVVVTQTRSGPRVQFPPRATAGEPRPMEMLRYYQGLLKTMESQRALPVGLTPEQQQNLDDKIDYLQQVISDLEEKHLPAPSAKPKTAKAKRVRVKGPKGQTGTVPEDSTLPEGWEIVD